MKVEAVFLGKKSNDLTKLKKTLDYSIVITFISMALGIILGTLVFILSETIVSNKIIDLFLSFFTDFSGKDFLDIFFGILFTNLTYFLILFLLGTCALGCIPIICITSFYSFGLGAITTALFSSYKIVGLEYFLLDLFPGKIIFIFAIVIQCHMCITTSTNIKKIELKDREVSFNNKQYIIKSFVIFLLFLTSSLVDAIMIKSFSSLFNFN